MTSVPWQDGWYVQPDNPLSVLKVQGDKVVHEKLAEIGIEFDRLVPKETETWKYGQFGETPPQIKDITGQDTYDIEMVHQIPVVGEIKSYGVLSQDKKTIHCLGHHQNLTSKCGSNLLFSYRCYYRFKVFRCSGVAHRLHLLGE